MRRIPEPDRTPDGPAFEGRLLDRPDDEVVDQGAGFDIRTLVTRRGVLGLLGLGVGAAALAACTPTAPSVSASSAASPTTAAGSSEIPQETNGPYPADGTQGVNVLTDSGIIRRDITSSLDGGTIAEGVPLALTFTVTDLSDGGAPMAGAAVYVWQCDARGLYSMYSEAIIDETYLRGVQIADANGRVTFETIVPGCYAGRWTHIHFEVYPDAASATTVTNQIATSQVAFPEDMLADVYALPAYDGSADNLAQIGGIDGDNVFGDGSDLQMATFSGDTVSGYVGSMPVAVDPTTEPTPSGAGGPGGGGPGGRR